MNWNWRDGRERYRKIRAGQFWRKRDTGRVMVVAARNVDNCWSVTFLGSRNGRAHHLKERDIYKYYDLV